MSLLARIFRIEVSVCLPCHGPMRLVRAVSCPEEVAATLHAARMPPACRPAAPATGTSCGQLPLFVA